MKIKKYLIILSIVICILFIPLIAMQFTNEVNWSFLDFIIGGLILFSFGLLIDLVFRKVKKSKYKVIIIISLIVILVLIWMELAVGLLGSPFAGS
jgi:uncharacterized protein YybS (DUF2232 family)